MSQMPFGVLLLIAVLGSCAPTATDDAGMPAQRAPGLVDPGFEALPPGRLHATDKQVRAWEIQQVGREAIQLRLRVDCIEDAQRAKSGRHVLALSIPADTVGFEYVTVGQRPMLREGRLYTASIWVRWPDGPERARANASPTSGAPSAIVSFWVRHRDGTGHFAGRDDWLFDRSWRRLSFRFMATQGKAPSLLYVSLLPNQKPTATTILVDDFELTEESVQPATDAKKNPLVADPGFTKQSAGPVQPPWYFANIGGTRIQGTVIESKQDRFVRAAMDAKTTNFESAQLWQHVWLARGVRYEVSCRIRWENRQADSPAPIVNYGIFQEATRTWYGPIDQTLKHDGEWHVYRFIHVPPESGPWKLYVQLNGWGNFQAGVRISVDDFNCSLSPAPAR